MRRLDLASLMFLASESKNTPMHIGALSLFEFPKGVNKRSFLEKLSAKFRDAPDLRKPLGYRLHRSPTGFYWKGEDDIDIDYHVRRSALLHPGGDSELFELVSRLHSTGLDRDRPLWEQHIIEGVGLGKFALYTKLHHAITDGIGLATLSQAMFSGTKAARLKHSPLSTKAYGAPRRYDQKQSVVADPVSKYEVANIIGAVRERIGRSVSMTGAFHKYLQAYAGRSNLMVPWHNVASSALNAQVGASRSFIAKSWEMERIRQLGKALDSTMNNVILAMCSGALRNYLLQYYELPDRPLTAMIPISLRDKEKSDSANQIAFVTANMATDVADVENRFFTIEASMRSGKEVYSGLSRREAEVFNYVTQAPVLAASLLGITPRFPHSSLMISNVPGAPKKLYLDGATLAATYPVAPLLEGLALNITLCSYADNLDFGIVACRRSLAGIEAIVPLMEDSLCELESMAGIKS